MSESVVVDAPTVTGGGVLGVTRSATGRRWVLRRDDPRAVTFLCQTCGVSDLVARVLAGRGIDPSGAAAFLKPRLRDTLPDPFSLRDMTVAAQTLAEAVRRKTPVGLLTDYDVDGATSAALMMRYLTHLGVPVLLHVPDRCRDGYGPNSEALCDLVAQGARVIVTLDCGTSAHEPLEAAEVPVVVIDHHKAEARLPQVHALVNPNRLDEDGRLGHLAAVGVTFLVVVAVNSLLRRGQETERHEAGKDVPDSPRPDLPPLPDSSLPDPSLPDPMRWLDLAALGTVCDVVPLTGLNRSLVAQGLKVMAAGGNVGLSALAARAGVSLPDVGVDALAFRLGPRINAAGRLGDSHLGSRLLATQDKAEAERIAETLDGLNRQRQEIQDVALAEARRQASDQIAAGHPVIVVADSRWHPGIAGILSGRLTRQYGCASFVFAGEGAVLRGSGRSVDGFDMGAAVIAARQSGLACSAGGHALAAGASVRADSVDDFAAFLRQRVPQSGIGTVPPLSLDGTLRPQSITLELARELARTAPFGMGNPSPRFALAGARLIDAHPVGMHHVRCVLIGADESPSRGRVKAMAFQALDGSPLGSFLLSSVGKPVYVAGTIRREFWQGREQVAFHIEDAAPA